MPLMGAHCACRAARRSERRAARAAGAARAGAAAGAAGGGRAGGHARGRPARRGRAGAGRAAGHAAPVGRRPRSQRARAATGNVCACSAAAAGRGRGRPQGSGAGARRAGKHVACVLVWAAQPGEPAPPLPAARNAALAAGVLASESVSASSGADATPPHTVARLGARGAAWQRRKRISRARARHRTASGSW